MVDDNPDYVIIGEGRTIMLEQREIPCGMWCDRCHAGIRYRETGIQCRKTKSCNDAHGRKELNLTTEQTIMVGDTTTTDIFGAGSRLHDRPYTHGCDQERGS